MSWPGFGQFIRIKKAKNFVALSLVFLIFVLQLLQPLSSFSQTEEISIIVNSANPVQKATVAELKALFLKEKTLWTNGEAVIPFDLDTSISARNTFLQKVVQLSPAEHDDYWIKKKHTDGYYPPQTITTERMMLRMVGKFKGGIGFVSSKALTSGGVLPPEIKVIGTVK